MTEKRFVPIGVEWTDGFIQDHEDDKDLFNVGAVCKLLNAFHEKNQDNEAMIEFLSTENSQIRDEIKTRTQIQHQLEEENVQLKKESYGNLDGLETYKALYLDLSEKYSNLEADYDELKDENQRLTNKLNNTALELVDDVISNGKAVEISEMSYSEFLDYRAKNGKPMELQL